MNPALQILIGLGPGTKAAPPFRASTTLNQSTGSTSWVVTVPTNSNDDALICALAVVGGGSPTVSQASWTVIDEGFDGAGNTLSIWRRIASSEPANYTFTISVSRQGVATMLSYSGPNTTTPVDVNGVMVFNSAVTDTVANSVTTTVANDTVLAITSSGDTTSTYTPPSGFTERVDFQGTGGGMSITVSDKAFAASGATGTQTTVDSVSARHSGTLVALRSN